MRELFNVIQQAVVFSRTNHIQPADITLPEMQGYMSDEVPSFREGRARTVAAFERTFVEDLLRKNGGNVSRAAQEAQKDRRTFGRLIKKYNIDRTRA